jgi:polyisoprenoid-binding protein YceI
MKSRKAILLALPLIIAFASVHAAESTFVLGKHGNMRNLITIESVTDLETIVTTSNEITGDIKWDRDAKTGSAKITVPVKSLKTGIDARDEHLQGEGWLDAAKTPDITFETTSVKAGAEANKYDIEGKFTMKGVTKDIKTTATVKYIEHKPEMSKMMPDANFMRISTTFDLKLSDYNVKLPVIGLKVNDTLKVKVELLGVEEKK